MAKFYGKIGYVETKETTPGVWMEAVTEREYFGDVLDNNVRRNAAPDSTNDNLSINNKISIVADPYAMNHFHSLKYAEFMGAKWKISDVTVSDHRLILTLGGVYNGK